MGCWWWQVIILAREWGGRAGQTGLKYLFLFYSFDLFVCFLTWCRAIARRKVSPSDLPSFMGEVGREVWKGLRFSLLISFFTEFFLSPDF